MSERAAMTFRAADRQPTTERFEMADGIALVSITIHVRGSYIPQHAHAHDHITHVASGSIAVWIDGVPKGIYRAHRPIFIAAGVKHLFRAEEDNTNILCIHRVDRTGEIDVLEVHHIVDGGD